MIQCEERNYKVDFDFLTFSFKFILVSQLMLLSFEWFIVAHFDSQNRMPLKFYSWTNMKVVLARKCQSRNELQRRGQKLSDKFWVCDQTLEVSAAVKCALCQMQLSRN